METIIYQMTELMIVDEDYEAVMQVKDGDKSSFDLLMFRYQDVIAKQMRRFSPKAEIIEELTQTVFVNAYQSINNYEPKAPFIHWLRTIASRVGYNYWREEAKKPKTVSLEDWDQKPEGAAESTELDHGVVLDMVLQKISLKERQVLCMVYLDKMSIKEVASTMGWTVAMVKMRSYRARNKLRNLLNDKELGGILNEYR